MAILTLPVWPAASIASRISSAPSCIIGCEGEGGISACV